LKNEVNLGPSYITPKWLTLAIPYLGKNTRFAGLEMLKGRPNLGARNQESEDEDEDDFRNDCEERALPDRRQISLGSGNAVLSRRAVLRNWKFLSSNRRRQPSEVLTRHMKCAFDEKHRVLRVGDAQGAPNLGA
jgi:hypothetical protein